MDAARQSAPGVYTSLGELLALRYAARGLDVFKPQLARSMLLGNVRSRFRGRGMEFEEVRQYQPGDDTRMIDWRVTARTGRTHTKLYAEERERPVHIIVDQRTSMFFGSKTRFKSVVAAELAACIAWASISASDRIGGQVVSDTEETDIRAKRNRRAVMTLLDAIVRYNTALPGNPTPDRSLTDILESCRRLTRPGTTIFVISDFIDFDDDAGAVLASIGRHTDLVLLQVRDPLESRFDLRGRLGFSDGERIETLDMTRDVVQRYRDAITRADELLGTAAAKAGAIASVVNTTDEPVRFLERLYRSEPAGRRR